MLRYIYRPMIDAKALLQAIFRHLREHPEELLRAGRNALGLKLGVPLAALRWLVAQGGSGDGPRDVVITAAPPGLRCAATVSLMGTEVRASAVVSVKDVSISESSIRVELRFAEVGLTLLDERAMSPVAALIKSGALDLSKPGNLAAYMPKRPAVLVEAEDDRLVLDLMKLPQVERNALARRLARLAPPLLAVRSVHTESDEHLDVSLKVLPDGLSPALEAARRAF